MASSHDLCGCSLHSVCVCVCLQRAKYSTGKLSLDDLLIKPVQRIPRYLLFIKDLLKHTSTSHPDHAPLQQALGELTGLAERVNESEREMARVDQQRDLLTSVDGLALVSGIVTHNIIIHVHTHTHTHTHTHMCGCTYACTHTHTQTSTLYVTRACNSMFCSLSACTSSLLRIHY